MICELNRKWAVDARKQVQLAGGYRAGSPLRRDPRIQVGRRYLDPRVEGKHTMYRPRAW